LHTVFQQNKDCNETFYSTLDTARPVAYGLPAKQGLQLICANDITVPPKVAYGLPAKQGLQHVEVTISPDLKSEFVAYGLPAKQGLQLASFLCFHPCSFVAYGLPAKQGLQR